MKLKATVSRIMPSKWQDMMSFLKVRVQTAAHGVVVWILRQSKSSRYSSQLVKWYALSFGIGKRWSFKISRNLEPGTWKPRTLTATLWCWLNWGLELPASGLRRRQPFSCSRKMPGPVLVIRWLFIRSYKHMDNLVWTVLLHPSNSLDLAPSDFHLDWWKMDCIRNVSVAKNCHSSCERVVHLHCCTFSQAQHMGSCSSLAKTHS